MRWIACVALLGLAFAACGGEEREVVSPASAHAPALQPGGDCPTTPVPRPPFVPPEPYPAGPPGYARSWYGTERLWTWLRADGTWPMMRADGAYFDKSFWWRPDGNPASFRVTGRRLDAHAPPVDITQATNGSRYDLGEFMLVGLELPELGCWEITGHYGAERVSFVVRVTRG